MGQGGALGGPRGVTACAYRPHHRGAPQQATCTKGVDARQGWWRGSPGQGDGGGATPGEGWG